MSIVNADNIEIKVSKDQHDLLFKSIQKQFWVRHVYYIDGKNLTLVMYRQFWMVPILLLLFPAFVLFYGLQEFKTLMKDYKRLINPIKYNAFTKISIEKTKEVSNILGLPHDN